MLKNKRNTYLLTFENLRKNFSKELKNLFKFLNLNLNINEIKEIMKRTELKKLKKKNQIPILELEKLEIIIGILIKKN